MNSKKINATDAALARARRLYGMHAMSEVQTENSFLTAPQLFERWQCSHMLIVARLKDDPAFPKPIYFGRRRRWRVSEIEKYERVVAGRGAPPKKVKTADAA